MSLVKCIFRTYKLRKQNFLSSGGSYDLISKVHLYDITNFNYVGSDITNLIIYSNYKICSTKRGTLWH